MRTRLSLVLWMLPVAAMAQGSGGETRFVRRLDAVEWRHGSVWQWAGEGGALAFEQTAASRFFLLGGRATNIQDEYQGRLRVERPVRERWSVVADARTLTYAATDLRQDAALAGVGYRSASGMSVRPMAGFMRDRRGGFDDAGWVGSLDLTAPESEWGDGWHIRPGAFLEYGDLGARRILTTRYATGIRYEEAGMRLGLDLRHGRSRREGYTSSGFLNSTPSPHIESIRTDTTGFRFTLGGPLTRTWRIGLDVDAWNVLRRVENRYRSEGVDPLYDSQSLRQSLDSRIHLVRNGPRFDTDLSIAWGVGIRRASLVNTQGLPQDQVNRREALLADTEADQDRLEVALDQAWTPGGRFSWYWGGSASILRYDTPESNPDDRDELALAVRLGQEYRLSEAFNTRIDLAGEATHYVFLKAVRSIENNWRRSIRLRNTSDWTPIEALTVRHQVWIRANYTVEDFQLAGRTGNDQSAREWGFETDTDLRLTPGWYLRTRVGRQELRIGKLFWGEFTEIPLDTLVTWDATMEIRHVRAGGEWSVGMRVFRRTDFQPRAVNRIPEGTRTATGLQTTHQWGPVVRWSLPLRGGHEIAVAGWYQVQAVRTRLYTIYPEAQREAYLANERRAVWRTFPNLDASVRFAF